MIWLSGAVRPELLGVREDLGVMLTPSMGNRPDVSRTWFACDTGIYSTGEPRPFEWERYRAFLVGLRPYRLRCLFATAPDVVRDWSATWARSRDVLPRIRELGYRPALVAQDGLRELPDGDYDCLFLGGSTAFKLAESTYHLAEEAKRRGLWVHVGRVNSLRRLRAMHLAGFDSADGTYVKYGPAINLPHVLRWLDTLQRMPSLLGAQGVNGLEEEVA